MLFSHDTEVSLAEAASLVNTVGLDGDTLVTLADLDDFLADHPLQGSFAGRKTSSNPYALCGRDCANSGRSRIVTR